MNKNDKIMVLGANGLVGKALVRNLKLQGYTKVIPVTRDYPIDLTRRAHCHSLFNIERPDYVFLAAAKVGGIHANNTYPAEFIYTNLAIQTNVIDACHLFEIKKLCFLGSVCIYPKYAEVPVKEESLLTGELEPTNQWYAIAKISGIKMCQAYHKQYGSNFISVMPCNLYGEGDNFHPTNSHVIPALIRRFEEAKEKELPNVICWGTGNARREFLYVDDMADACIFLMNCYNNEQIINIGFGCDFTIKEIVEKIVNIIEYKGKIEWDLTKPDGTPKRMLDSTKLFKLGWKPKITLDEGLEKTIKWYKLHKNNIK